MVRPARDDEREHGQIIVLFALALVVILAFGSIVVDLGFLRNDRQILVNALDSAALAGGTLLPVDGSGPGGPAAAAAETKIITDTIAADYPGLVVNKDYTIQYKCLIGADVTGPLISQDVPSACDPRPSMGLGVNLPPASAFTGAGATRVSSCNPGAGDKCNVVLITGSATTPYSLGQVVGVTRGSTGVVVSAACNGGCGLAPLTLNDVELVIDTSGSMNGNNSGTPSSPRIYWAKQAANQFVSDLSTNGGIGATGNRLGITTFSGTTANSIGSAWTSTAAQLTTSINAITASGTTPTKVGLNTGAADLIGHARNAVGGTVKRVIILLSDGRPNPDQGPNGKVATSAVNNMRPTQADLNTYLGSADVAYSILIGTSPTLYPVGKVPPPQLDPNIVDPDMMKFLATPDKPAAPPAPAQTYFFNVVDASGLPSVFHQIASQILTHHAQLVQVYPTPIVTSLSQTAGTYVGGNTLTINGQYLNDAQNVTFGGVPAVVVSVTDSAITVKAPAGTNGQTVDVVVTTLGGTSPITSADQYKYN
jgi:uncharacterized protein YegL